MLRLAAIFSALWPWRYICRKANNYIKRMEENKQQQEATAENAEMNINADENTAGTEHLNEPVADENPLEKLEAALAEQKDKYLRLMAEFDNFRRRSSKERLEYMQTAGKEVIVSMLDVLDDCERAEKQIEKATDIAAVKEGVHLVFAKLKSTLQSKGLKPLESINTEFDVEKHEAITEIPAPTPELQGKVIDEVQKGYYLNDKLIRFAKVVVGK